MHQESGMDIEDYEREKAEKKLLHQESGMAGIRIWQTVGCGRKERAYDYSQSLYDREK